MVFSIKFYDFWWKPHLNRIKWRRVSGYQINQISRHMTIYVQTLGVFKRENNECIRNWEKTYLHKIKVVVLWRVLRHEVRHCDVIWRNSWRNTLHSITYAKLKKLQFWFYVDMSCQYIQCFRVEIPLKFDHIWSCGRRSEFIWLPVTLRHFIRLRWGFHGKYCFSMTKMIPFWTLLFKFFVLLPKIGVIYVINLSRKAKNTFTVVKICRTFSSNENVPMSCVI